MVTRHEFLSMLHERHRPNTYLEVGVQFGTSLKLASQAAVAVGIDPTPLCHQTGNQQIFSVTADDYFQYHADPDLNIDFAFIDGSHLFEDALRDFINVEMHSNSNTVVVFDDVLPYNQSIAGRTPLPGDWTGDVWKIYEILQAYRTDLHVQLVDTFPTGSLLVWRLDSSSTDLLYAYDTIMAKYRDGGELPVPEFILNRSPHIAPADLAIALWEQDK